MCRVGQKHIYTVYIRYFWQGNHQIYGHIRCAYTVLANPIHVPSLTFLQDKLQCKLLRTELSSTATVCFLYIPMYIKGRHPMRRGKKMNADRVEHCRHGLVRKGCCFVCRTTQWTHAHNIPLGETKELFNGDQVVGRSNDIRKGEQLLLLYTPFMQHAFSSLNSRHPKHTSHYTSHLYLTCIPIPNSY